MKYKRDLSKPLAPTYGDEKKKKKKNESSVLKLTQAPNDYALVDTTGYSKGKQSFPYTWHRSSGFGYTNKKTTSNHSFSRNELNKHIKNQNPSHKSIMNKGMKKASKPIVSKMLKRFKKD